MLARLSKIANKLDCIGEYEAADMIDNIMFVYAKKKSVPVNKKLWEKVQYEAKKKFRVFPSAYANLWASKEYKSRGGKWKYEAKSSIDFSDSESIKNLKQVTLSNYKKLLESKSAVMDLFSRVISKDRDTRVKSQNLDSDSVDKNKTMWEREVLRYLVDDLTLPTYTDMSLDDMSTEEIVGLNDFFDFIDPIIENIIENIIKTKQDRYNDERFRRLLYNGNVRTSKSKNKGGLGKWLDEKWVDISRKDKGGKHPPCGRPESSSKAYPKCRPQSEANKMTSKEKDSAVEQKRRRERKKPKSGKGNAPTRDSHTKKD